MEENKNIPEQTPDNILTEEILSEENIEAETLATESTASPQTQNMEVHHAHHPTHKKKWNEYLLEFFMLFLAVFLGFVAENIRENNVERHREKEYMESLVNDIRADTANAGVVNRDFLYRQPYMDSVMENFGAMLRGNGEIYAKFYGKAFNYFDEFNPSDGTMQQLKNAGGLRLIRKKNVVDSVLYYDATIKLVNSESNHLTQDKYAGLWNSLGSYINFYKIDTLKEHYGAKWYEYAGDLFSTTDLQKRLEFYHKLKYVQTASKPYLPMLYQYKSQGTRLIELLRKEYHLKND